MKKSILALVVLSLLLAGVANATMVSGPFTTSTPIPLTLTDFSGSLAFPKFNPALGTLTEVKLVLTGSINTVLTIRNTGTENSEGNAKTQVSFNVQDSGLNLVAGVPDAQTAPYDFSGLQPGNYITTGTISKTSSNTQYYTDPVILNEFTGAGNMVLNAATTTIAWIGYTGGNTIATQVTDGALTGNVTYYYIPEPATLALVVLGIGLLRRRSH
ncbi:MAG: choice-of-anchor E domain-containing protein [Phycisphaerae bacterium]